MWRSVTEQQVALVTVSTVVVQRGYTAVSVVCLDSVTTNKLMTAGPGSVSECLRITVTGVTAVAGAARCLTAAESQHLCRHLGIMYFKKFVLQIVES